VEVSNEIARSKIRISFRDAKSRLAKRKEKETTDITQTNDTLKKETELENYEDMEPLPLTSLSLSKRDNEEISTTDDSFFFLPSVLSEGTDDDIAIQDDHFPLSIAQLQQQEQLKLQVMNMNSNISSVDRNIREFNSNFKTLVNQQISDSSTSSFLGLDGSYNVKRQRLCSPPSIIGSSCIENKDYKVEL